MYERTSYLYTYTYMRERERDDQGIVIELT